MEQLAIFQTPYVPPKRKPHETFDWLVKQAIEADRLGFAEYWVGEHATVLWEVVPSPELVLAAAARETKQIILAPGAHLLPYHHPATLAVQVSWMTHLTRGRYILGVGAGAFPSDAALRGMKDLSQNHRMVVESLEIMKRIWAAEPFEYDGEFWKAGYPKSDPNFPNRDIRPYGGHVRIGIAGLTMNSSSIKFAGTGGYLPLSIALNSAQLANHWSIYSQAARGAGREPKRSDHHALMEIFVGETDAEARREALDGPMGEAWRAYILHAIKLLVPDILRGVAEGADLKTQMEHIADNVWVVGSPETVVEKLCARAEAAGGPWGTTMLFGYDYSENPEPWNQSLALLARKVLPRLKKEFVRMSGEPVR
jgi:3,6-diketocamphane 1,6-monooxygenase